MAKEGRNAKGQFIKGNTEGISTEVAREYQLRSAAARKQNRTLAELMRTELLKRASEKGPMTKGEFLIAKALENHSHGKLTFKDLKDLQAILGESKLTLQHEGGHIVPMPQEAIDALMKWAK